MGEYSSLDSHKAYENKEAKEFLEMVVSEIPNLLLPLCSLKLALFYKGVDQTAHIFVTFRERSAR